MTMVVFVQINLRAYPVFTSLFSADWTALS